MEFSIPDIVRPVHVAVPYVRLVSEFLPLVKENRLNLEIGLGAEALTSFKRADFEKTVLDLKEYGARFSLHGPFMDLAPGAIDDSILDATRKRLDLFAEAAPVFDPVSIVLHTGWDRKRYNDLEEQWMERAFATFSALFERLLATTDSNLAIENVYDKTPRILSDLFERLDDSRIGFCFDPGHANAFSSTSIEGWLEVLGHKLMEIHVHDNMGEWDDRIAVGAGNICFNGIFSYLAGAGAKPLIVCEAHSAEDVVGSLSALEKIIRETGALIK